MSTLGYALIRFGSAARRPVSRHPRLPRRWRSPLVLGPPAVLALALAGCGGGEDPAAIAELEEQLAPDTVVGEDDDEGGGEGDGEGGVDPDEEELRFDPETYTCEPRKDSVVSGSWETAAPRAEVDDDSVRLALRDTTRTDEVQVKARVAAPDDSWSEATTTLEATEWVELTYPDDFEPEPDDLDEGVYTVVWSVDGEGARTFLSCDGFEVE